MARGVNKVILLGNLGKDPDLRVTPSGTSVATFSIAVNRNVKEGDGWKEQTEWVRCVAWEKQAETIGQYVKKAINSTLKAVCRPASGTTRKPTQNDTLPKWLSRSLISSAVKVRVVVMVTAKAMSLVRRVRPPRAIVATTKPRRWSQRTFRSNQRASWSQKFATGRGNSSSP